MADRVREGLRRGAALLAVALWSAVTAPVLKADTRMSLEEARALAGQLLQSGRLPEARDLAMGLLQADRRDVAALIIVSQAERTLGRPDVARDAGAAAWAFATTPAQHYAAAVVTAQAHVALKEYTRSQFWLRRAAQNAPDEAAGSIVARDYGRLRQINPVTLSFGARVSPSTNVNNGSANRTTTFEGIPFVFTLSPEARALSGVEASISAGLKYRLSAGARSATHLTLDLYNRQIAFSAASRAAAPDARPGDYAYAQASLGLVHTWKPASRTGSWTAGLVYGRSLYGGSSYTQSGQAYLTRAWELDKRTRLSLSAGVESTRYLQTDRHSDSVSVKVVWARTLPRDRALSLSLGLSDTKASRVTGTFTELSLGAKFGFGELFEGVDLMMSYQLDRQHYPVAGLIAGSRIDLRQTISAEVGLKKASFFGFEPVVSVEASRKLSNVDFYDSAAVKLGLNLRSSF
jgi:hypothetical protein